MAVAISLRRGVRDHYSAYIARPDTECGQGYAGWGYKDLDPLLTEVNEYSDIRTSFTTDSPPRVLIAAHTHTALV